MVRTGKQSSVLKVGGQVIAHGHVTRIRHAWVPRQRLECRHTWVLGDDRTELAIHFSGGHCLSREWFNVRAEQARMLHRMNPAGWEVPLLQPDKIEDLGLLVRQSGPRVQFFDEAGVLIFEHRPAWQDSQAESGILDEFGWDASRDVALLPTLVELSRLWSRETLRSYCLP